MDASVTDFNADSRDRLWRLLELNNVRCRNQLKASVDTAGAQLEWFKPSLMTHRKDGFYAGPTVMYPTGTTLILLAHDKKAFSIRLCPRSNYPLAEAIKATVDYIKPTIIRELETDNLNVGDLVPALEEVIKKYGAAPSKNGKELSQEHNARVLGCLFAYMSDERISDIAARIEQIAAEGICPALIGLLGKADGEKGLYIAWPQVFAVAPYADRIVETN